MNTTARTALRAAAGFGYGLAIGLTALAAIKLWQSIDYVRLGMQAVRAAGFVEKCATVNGVTINYAEGPDNGPPLLLIHGQMTDWSTYMKVLPQLSQQFYVYAIHCYGHGQSERVPERYTNLAMGHDQAQFLREVIGEPAFISGNSSGGLLGIQIALEAPELVRGLVLEDPPLFSSQYPRFPSTAGYDLPRLAHEFLASDETDFPAFHVARSSFVRLFGDLAPMMIRHATAQRGQQPPQPIHWWYLPPAMNEMYRVLGNYDPLFGEAFYTGAWHDGFDHADALATLSVPTTLIHANWRMDPSGETLLGAMNDDDAAYARELIPEVDFRRVNAGHAVHADKPRLFTTIVEETAGLR
ncbi:alpha/beta fold hydrolase [Citricoccus sp. GCM10030269]|uniref:alpha/beta fold hydrolase n=1 Tax=Citricoccus sp. GCM10030269 TaxID=3273388 RepID=UPI00361430C5